MDAPYYNGSDDGAVERWGSGASLAGLARLEGDIELMLREIAAGNASMAGWWACHAVKTARRCGLWPTTAELERAA